MQSPTWNSCLNMWKLDDRERKEKKPLDGLIFKMGKNCRDDVNKSDQSPREKIKGSHLVGVPEYL